MARRESSNPEMKLAIQYYGIDVERGRMSAIDLGPAIFGLGKMVSQASKVLYGDATKVHVEVQADFERGSFGVEFFAVAQTGDLLPPLSLADLEAMLKHLGLIKEELVGIASVLGIIRWLKGRRVERAEKTGDEVTITVHDESMTLNITQYNLFADAEIRKGFQALAAPLESEGVERVDIQAENRPPERITRSERGIFRGPSLPEEGISVDGSVAVLEVVGPVFKAGNKWRFAQESAEFFAEILDDNFLDRVSEGEIRFGSGDAIKVEMETETTRSEGKLHYERRILKVLDYIPGRGEGQAELFREG